MSIDYNTFQSCLHGDARRQASRLSTLSATNPAIEKDLLFLRSRLVVAARLGRLDQAAQMVQRLEATFGLPRASIIQDLSSTPEASRPPLQGFIASLMSTAGMERATPGGQSGSGVLIAGGLVVALAAIGILIVVLLGRNASPSAEVVVDAREVASGLPASDSDVASVDRGETIAPMVSEPIGVGANGVSGRESSLPPSAAESPTGGGKALEDADADDPDENSVPPASTSPDTVGARGRGEADVPADSEGPSDAELDAAKGRFEDNRKEQWDRLCKIIDNDPDLKQAMQQAKQIAQYEMRSLAAKSANERKSLVAAESATLLEHAHSHNVLMKTLEVWSRPAEWGIFFEEEVIVEEVTTLPPRVFIVARTDPQDAWLDVLLSSIQEDDEKDIPADDFEVALVKYLDEYQVDVPDCIENLQAVICVLRSRETLQNLELAVCRSLLERHRTLIRRRETDPELKAIVMPVNRISDIERTAFVLVDPEITIGGKSIPLDARQYLEWIAEQLKAADSKRSLKLDVKEDRP